MTMGVTISPLHKSFPPAAWGSSTVDFLSAGPGLDEFQTPLLTLDRGNLSANIEVMFAWLRDAGLLLAPHGKTTMSPRLWQELIDAGAWGLTLATGWQVQVAYSFGFKRIMLANTVVDPVALGWLAGQSDEDADLEVICWVDSVEAVKLMTGFLVAANARRRIRVIIELGAPGGRMGSRSVDEALQIALAASESPQLELVGVGGYEGALAHDRSAKSIARVESYLEEVVRLYGAVIAAGYCSNNTPILTLGGSAYFDLVAARTADLGKDATLILRAGAFQIHDDIFYDQISPMGSLIGKRRFSSAMHVWARVISHPEPGLILFDAGKRDLPFDEGLPVAQRIVGLSPAQSRTLLNGSLVTALNDQHGFLQLSPDAMAKAANESIAVPLGSVIRLGLSHPCTALDKWKLVPIIEDADAECPRVIDAVETWF